MKNWFALILIVLLVPSLGIAQPVRKNVERRIEAQRIAFITERLNLSPEESQQFWPVYNQYRDALKDIREDKIPERPIEDLNDQEAEKLINNNLDAETRELALKKEYVQKLRKVIPPRKIVLLMKAELEFKAKLLKEVQRRKEDRGGF